MLTGWSSLSEWHIIHSFDMHKGLICNIYNNKMRCQT